jgi:hypothetical protein
VIDMFMDEYDEEKIGALFREDGRREGLAEGRGMALAELVRDGLLGVEDAAARADVSEDEMRRMAYGEE